MVVIADTWFRSGYSGHPRWPPQATTDTSRYTTLGDTPTLVVWILSLGIGGFSAIGGN